MEILFYMAAVSQSLEFFISELEEARIFVSFRSSTDRKILQPAFRISRSWYIIPPFVLIEK